MGSGHFSDDLIDRVRQETDIVRLVSGYVSLKKSGQNWSGLCPFHSEKTPSFSVSPVKQFFHCFGCGEGGDAIGFTMKMDGMAFPQAVRFLAEKAGIPLPARSNPADDKRAVVREESFKVQKEAADFFHASLNGPGGAKARDYLFRRGVSPEMSREYSLGYAPAGWHPLQHALEKKGWKAEQMERAGLVIRNKEAPQADGTEKGRRYYDRFRDRLMFPIFDLQKRVTGFGGRILGEGTPKYLNSPETGVFSKGSQLYGLEKAREEAGKRGYLVIVEGYMDVIRLRQAGFQAAAATLGTALTEAHVRIISRFVPSVKLVFDSDAAGIRAALRAMDILIPSSITGEVVLLPAGEDPDSFVKSRGLDAFEQMLGQAEKVLDFAIRRALEDPEVESIEGKLRFVDRILPVIRKIQRPVERKFYVKQLAERLGLDESELTRELGGLSRVDLSDAVPGANKITANLPPEEKILVQLLLHDPSGLGTVDGKITPADFSHPELREIYSHLTRNAVRGGDAVISGNEAGSAGLPQNRLTAALSLTEPDFEDSQRTLMDCIQKIRLKRIRAAMKNIEVRIRDAERSGDDPSVNHLLSELMDLKRKAMDFSALP